MGWRHCERVLQVYHGKSGSFLYASSQISFSGRDAADITNDAKVLYAMLLDRASISKQNGYVEPDGTIRLYFTVEQAQERLHRSRQCVTRIFRELEYSGLITRKKQGLGRPALITLNYPADAKLIVKEVQP